MKTHVEIEELTVKEALDLLHKAVMQEALEGNGSCGEESDSEYRLNCTRGKGHKGVHIATGSEEVYEIWKQ